MKSNPVVRNALEEFKENELIIASKLYKEKLRSRSYGLAERDKKVFLELKKKKAPRQMPWGFSLPYLREVDCQRFIMAS